MIHKDEVYPRECGGTAEVGCVGLVIQGLSPRVRGNPRRQRQGQRSPGVYPRECGGTCLARFFLIPSFGLSPRVRGNPSIGFFLNIGIRSIPASAGEPLIRRRWSNISPVYPRECGGTAATRTAATCPIGLSPRVRGNLAGEPQHFSGHRSIPASAGEPNMDNRIARQEPVYPRECGGTGGYGLGVGLCRGLSPRVRGNPLDAWRCGNVRGSIPASAGEPPSTGSGKNLIPVYPRECGGTRLGADPPPRTEGLSPRVRGNHWSLGEYPVEMRSIPASAGEPGVATSLVSG